MSRTAVEVPAPAGRCPATLHVPDDGTPSPGVLLFPDAGGVRETFRSMADRLAALGYVVLLPDVYYRSPGWRAFEIPSVFDDAAERARLLEMAVSVSAEQTEEDSAAFLEFLLARPEVAGERAGTTGYCMGGRMSLIAAAHRDRVAAAASFHGGGIAVAEDPTSPHRNAARIGAEVYVAGAVDDEYFTREHARLLDSALTDARVRHVIEFYEARHGFAVPDNPTHDPAAEQRHWQALQELFARALPLG